jgi:alpha-glucosidase
LPKFNWKSQELRKRFIQGKASVVAKWLKAPYNFDGWRIDVANMTGRIRDEDMYLEVAQTARKTMVEVNPDTIMLGEYTGDAAYEVQGDGWQGAMTYSNFTKPVWRWFFDSETLKSKKKVGPKDVPGFMTGDGELKTGAKELVRSYRSFIAAFPWHVRLHNMNPLDTHDIPRFKTFAVEGAQKVAAGLQFSFPGIPVIWAGDEFGLDGFNGEASRTPLPWNDERPSDKHMIDVYSALADLRRENSALVDGSMRFLYASDEALVFVRENKKQSILVCATRGKDASIELPLFGLTAPGEAELIYGKSKLVIGKKKVKIEAGKLSFAVWRLPAAV